MIDSEADVVIIGGGPAGLAAAISAKESGANNVIIIDRNSWFGGILPQCIHDGFGVEELGKSLTGPEYAEMYIDQCKKNNITFLKETMVLELTKNLEVIIVNKNGLNKINAKSIVLAMGCREKTRWNAMIPGDRPSGIFTAGVAQGFINLYNIMLGENIVIIGSGDVGLIMARRLKFEGANLLGVIEILPYASGLTRNVVQCLDDYDIPIYLNHTVTNIKGRNRLESIIIAQINEKNNIINGTEKEISCDTLLLSLGLIPENELSKKAGIMIDNLTGGPIIDQYFETSLSGVFACGNCVQVYDTVDVLSTGAKIAGESAAKFSNGKIINKKNTINVKTGNGIVYITPQKITKSGNIDFTFRVKKPQESVIFYLKNNENIIFKKKLCWVNPANMIKISVNVANDNLLSKNNLEAYIDD